MHDGRDRQDGGKGHDPLGLTADVSISKIVRRSNDHKNVSVASQVLAPLVEGIPVVLEVDDPRLPKRKRVEKPLMFLVPYSVFGVGTPKLMVSVQTHGCEVFDTATEIPPLMLTRLGLSMKLSTALATELNLVFKKGAVNGPERS